MAAVAFGSGEAAKGYSPRRDPRGRADWRTSPEGERNDLSQRFETLQRSRSSPRYSDSTHPDPLGDPILLVNRRSRHMHIVPAQKIRPAHRTASPTLMSRCFLIGERRIEKRPGACELGKREIHWPELQLFSTDWAIQRRQRTRH